MDTLLAERDLGDKSIDKLDKEPPPDTVLARFGMLLVPANEDKNVPDIALAYDANEPPPVREGATGGSEDEAAYIRRPGQSPSGRPEAGRPVWGIGQEVKRAGPACQHLVLGLHPWAVPPQIVR